MFAHYGRSETSFVCTIRVPIIHFRTARITGQAIFEQRQFPRYLEENEFVLMMEIDEAGHPTGREQSLFVMYANSETIQMEVLTENPDEFWRKQIQTSARN